jgi:methyl-accepting chemotaxis protein
VAEINDLVGEIASSSKEQAVGLAEVNQAVNGLVPGEWREF